MAATPSAAAVAAPAPHVPAGPPGGGASGPTQFAQNVALHVSDLAASTTETHLFDLFNSVSPVASIRLCRDVITQHSLRYAYVNFATHEGASAAFRALADAPINGKPCRISWAQRNPEARRSGVGNIFVKELPPSLTTHELIALFEEFGTVVSAKVELNNSGQSKRYGFVQFATKESADRAIRERNGYTHMGCTLFVGPFKKNNNQRDTSQWTNLYVKNIPLSWGNERLKALFETVGPVKSVKVEMDRVKGTSRGFGYVDFERHEDAVRAVEELHRKDVSEPATGAAPEAAAAPASAPAPATATTPAAAATDAAPAADVKPSGDAAAAPAVVSTPPAADGAAAAAAPAPVNYAQAVSRGAGSAAPKAAAQAATKAAVAPKAAATAPKAATPRGKRGGKRGTRGGRRGAGGAGAAAAGPQLLHVCRHQTRKERSKQLLERRQRQVQERQRNQDLTLFCKNLPATADDEWLRTEFGSLGTITSCRVVKTAGRKSLVGFVGFSTPEEASHAIAAMNGQQRDGKALYVALAQRKELRPGHVQRWQGNPYSAPMRPGYGQPMPGYYPPHGGYAYGHPQAAYAAQQQQRAQYAYAMQQQQQQQRYGAPGGGYVHGGPAGGYVAGPGAYPPAVPSRGMLQPAAGTGPTTQAPAASATAPAPAAAPAPPAPAAAPWQEELGGRLYQHVVRIDGDPTRANHITTSIVASTSREQLEGVLSDVSQLPGIVATVKEQLHI